ncbi:MAG: hypothetical protein ACE37F_22860 [Nannocystaceae bacterium]|nr:hypothetical protein [bacterium]
MLDLKAKLASAGLVSQKDIDRVEAKKKKGKRKKKGKGGGPGKPGVRPLDVKGLRDAKKGELYDAVRRWVEKARLDRLGIPSERCEPFHFPEIAGRVGRLMIEPELSKRVQAGDAAVIAFMSNSGLAHAVVPAAGARDVATLKEEWLRVLPGDPRAGKIIKE